MAFAQVVRVVARWSQGGAALCPGLSHLAPLGQWIWPGEFTYAHQHHLSGPHWGEEVCFENRDYALAIKREFKSWARAPEAEFPPPKSSAD
jgi:hypothetical protein